MFIVVIALALFSGGTSAGGNLSANSQGMGRMDLGRAFDSTAGVHLDQTQTLGATGNLHQVSGSVVSSSQPFRVTLAWSEAPEPTSGASYVNNLDLEVTVGGILYRGNVFTGANSTSGVYVLRGPYSLGSFAGQTVRIQWRATTDFSLTTTFRVDDVTVQG